MEIFIDERINDIWYICAKSTYSQSVHAFLERWHIVGPQADNNNPEIA